MLGIEKKKLLQPLIAHVQVLHLTRFCITHCAEDIALVQTRLKRIFNPKARVSMDNAKSFALCIIETIE